MDKLNEPLAAALSRLKVLNGDESTDATSVRLPETRPSVTARRRDKLKNEPTIHTVDVSDCHIVDSQLLALCLMPLLKSTSPRLPP